MITCLAILFFTGKICLGTGFEPFYTQDQNPFALHFTLLSAQRSQRPVMTFLLTTSKCKVRFYTCSRHQPPPVIDPGHRSSAMKLPHALRLPTSSHAGKLQALGSIALVAVLVASGIEADRKRESPPGGGRLHCACATFDIDPARSAMSPKTACGVCGVRGVRIVSGGVRPVQGVPVAI